MLAVPLQLLECETGRSKYVSGQDLDEDCRSLFVVDFSYIHTIWILKTSKTPKLPKIILFVLELGLGLVRCCYEADDGVGDDGVGVAQYAQMRLTCRTLSIRPSFLLRAAPHCAAKASRTRPRRWVWITLNS